MATFADRVTCNSGKFAGGRAISCHDGAPAATAHNELTDTHEPCLLIATRRADTKVVPLARSEILSASTTQPLTILNVYAGRDIPRLYRIAATPCPAAAPEASCSPFSTSARGISTAP
jgi:hypothetical protein